MQTMLQAAGPAVAVVGQVQGQPLAVLVYQVKALPGELTLRLALSPVAVAVARPPLVLTVSQRPQVPEVPVRHPQ